MGRQKPHAQKENFDPYAEGWDAYGAGVGVNQNPYQDLLMAEGKRRSPRQLANVESARDRWTQGWREAEADDMDDAIEI